MDTNSTPWLDTRSAGVLAHISSLPGDYGIGNLGAAARALVDFLAEAGFRHWQICPIGPTGYGDSPYQLFSSHAGNPYFIDLGELESTGLLQPADLKSLRSLPADRADYGRLYEEFWPVLAIAYERFMASGAPGLPGQPSFADFKLRRAEWLGPFTTFMALKASFGGVEWARWPREFRAYHPAIADGLAPALRRDADRHAFYQYLFFGQWERLRAYASSKGIGVIGDVPIFVAMDSADTWQHPEVFQFDAEGRPLAVAGVPPDYFSELGQLWGNPLYNWSHHAATGYAWWIARLASAFELYDIVRLDHFRGFDSYWEIPAGASDARGGRWVDGPGMDFIVAVQRALPKARIIAEDLGYIGPRVVSLRNGSGFPGMKILQFAYGHDANNCNLPHFYPSNSVVYTGTHDNVTARGWLESLDGAAAAQVGEYFGLDGSRSAWPMIKVALSTTSRLAVLPMQDLLDLPSSATFNRPGTDRGNWQWRYTARQLASLRGERAVILRHWIQLYDRQGDKPIRDYSEAVHHA